MSTPTPANPPKKRKSRMLKILGIGVILLAVLILSGPGIVANTGLRDKTINRILSSPTVTASSQSASFSWFSPLSVEGLQLKSNNDRIQISIERMSADQSLTQLLGSAPDLGTITLDKPHVQLMLPVDIPPTVDRRLEPTFRAIVKDASLTVRGPNLDEPILDVDGVSMTVRVEATEDGRVLIVDPVVIFDKRIPSPKLCDKLLYLFHPTLGHAPQIQGEVSLSLDKMRIPLGIPRDQQVNRMEAEGKLTLHKVGTEVKNPVIQEVVQVLADLYGKEAPEIINVIQDAEIRFKVRDGRMSHEGLRFGFPQIDPALVVSSYGSIGLDQTLDLHLDLPRLDKAKRKEKGPIKCHVTGTLKDPRMAVRDASLVVRLPNRKEPIIDADGINLNMRIENVDSVPMITMEPMEIFKKEKVSLEVGAGLLNLIEPDTLGARQITGEISLTVDKLRIPLGVRGEERLKLIEVEGKLTLHKVGTEVKSPLNQALIQMLADLYDKDVSEVVHVVQDAEVRFQVRNGRMSYEGLRFGFPEIDPELVVVSRGSVGLDQTLDLLLELPRLDKAKRKQKGPIKCHVTGTLKEPKIAIRDASLVVRLPNRKLPIIDADGINLNMKIETVDSVPMLTMEPVEIFKKEKLSLELAAGLVQLIEPDVAETRQITGEISLAVNKLRIPLGVRGEQRLKRIEVDGKLTLHHVTTEPKNPLRQAVIRLLADLNGKQATDIVRVVQDAEISFQVRNGRLAHEGLRFGFPEIDPELVVKSRGSVGLDETLDVHLELPRLRKDKRQEEGPVQCHITGTIRNPRISIKDATLVLNLTGGDKPLLTAGHLSLTYSIEDTKNGRMLVLEPLTVFKKLKVTPELGDELLQLIVPTMGDVAGVHGEISLSLDTFRIPLGVTKEEFIRRVELAGKLQLHEISTTTKAPLLETMAKVCADMYGKKPSEVVRIVNEAEVRFQMREGRLHHEGLRIGFPDIAPELLASSRGSVGLDKSLDLVLEIPRLVVKLKQDQADLKNTGPVRLRITGSIGKPIVTEIKDDKGK